MKAQAKQKKFCSDACRYQWAKANNTAYGQLKSKLEKLIDKKAQQYTKAEIAQMQASVHNATAELGKMMISLMERMKSIEVETEYLQSQMNNR